MFRVVSPSLPEIAEEDVPSAEVVARPQQSDTLVLDRRVSIVGSLSFDGSVVLAGHVEGEIRCRDIEIQERGSVDGDVVAKRVVVLGEVAGSIHADELVLKAASAVEGDIFHRHLLLEDGSYFEGRSRRHGNPLRLAADKATEAGDGFN